MNFPFPFVIPMLAASRGLFLQLKAPHAYRSPPPRPHYPRSERKRRLFKGHRP